MDLNILAYGPPLLTVTAADAALDLIDLIAAEVRGVDTIDVTNVMRPIWRTHLAYWYQQLPPPTRAWYANAPATLSGLRAQWPQVADWQRAQLVQQWSFELPYMLAMLNPVLSQAQAAEMSHQTARNLAAIHQTAALPPPAVVDSERAAVEHMANSAMRTQSLINLSNSMTNATIGLMRSINRS